MDDDVLDSRKSLDILRNFSSQGTTTFESFSRLSFQAAPNIILNDQLTFSYSSAIAPRSSGWQIVGNLFTWQGKAERARPITLPLQPSTQPKPISLDYIDTLWLDYSGASSIAICKSSIKLVTQTQTYGAAPKINKNVWATKSNSLIEILDLESAQESDLKATDNYYFMGRQLRFEPDEHWRYRQVENFTLLQRRMHHSLKHALTMEVAIKPGTVLKQVNLMVHTKDNLGNGKVVEFNNLPTPTVLSDGRLGVLLDIGGALQQRFPDAFAKNSKHDEGPSLFLQEMFVYFLGEAGKIVADKPLLGVKLFGNKVIRENYTNTLQILHDEDVALNAFNRRIKLDLRPINAGGRVELIKAEINLHPEPNGSECAIKINAVRLVGTYNKKVPVFTRQVEDWSRRWGGPFKLTAPEYDQLEQPGIISYLPLNALDEPRIRTNQSVDHHFELPRTERAVVKEPPLRVMSEIGQVISTGNFLQSAYGANLISAGGMIKAPNAQGHWQLSGDSATLYIHWPVDVSIGPDTLFYAADDGPEQITGLAVTIHTTDGRRLERLVSSNTAVPLVKTPTNVKSLQIAFSPKALPYQLKIKELVLFEPSVMSYAEAFRLRLPRELSVTPKPLPLGNGSESFVLKPGHASRLVSGDTQNYRFTTKLDTPLLYMRGLSLKFRFPPQITTGGPCTLRLTFKFERAKFDRQLCLNELTGQTFVPLAALLGKEQAGRNLGALQSIDWAIHLSGAYAKDKLTSFSLDFSLEGWAYQSAADRLLSTPLFTLDGKPVYAKIDSLPDDSAKLPNKLWLPLEQDDVERLLGSNGKITPVENDLFKLEQVVMEPTKLLDRKTWDKFTNPPNSAVSPHWPKWLLWASMLLLAWASARKGWWSPAKTWLFVKRLISTLFWAVSIGTGYIGQRLWFMLPWTATWESRFPGLARLVGWTVLTLALYGAGLFQKVLKGENYFFTFGGMAALLVLRASFLLLKPWLRRADPKLAASIFDGAGSLYFASAIVGLVLTALLLTATLEPFAEQVAVVVYYCLVVGTVLEVMALRRDQKRQAQTATPPAQERPVT
jgi:hypothetical protein